MRLRTSWCSTERHRTNNCSYVVLNDPNTIVRLQYSFSDRSAYREQMNMRSTLESTSILRSKINIKCNTHVVVITSKRASRAMGRIGFFLYILFYFCSKIKMDK
jgi:hypothetical protein